MRIVWIIVLLIASLTVPVYSAVDQPTHAIVKDIIKTYVLSLQGTSQNVKIIGLGSWVFGRKYRDPLGALNGAKPSDHDMFLVCDLADDEALAEWKAFRKYVVSQVTARFGDNAPKILENINIYPPEQLMEGVDSPAQALCRFKLLDVNPNLAGGPIDGWWGKGSRAWKDAYAASNGKIWWYEAGECRVGIADALNHRTACRTYTLAGAASVSTSVVENTTASILAGDAAGLKKNLARLRSTIAKGRSLAGLNPDPFLDGVMAKLKQFDETPEGLKKLKDFLAQNSEFGEEMAQALEKARFQSAALKLLTEKPNARLANSIFEMLQAGTGKWARAKDAMMKLAGKVPWRPLIGATAAFLVVLDAHDTYSAYKEGDYEKLMGKLIINAGFSAGLGTGAALMLTQAILDDAKEYGYSLAIQRQDADDLLAGIYQVRGREKLVDDQTLEQSIERLATDYSREEDVRKLVQEHACEAAKREDGGANTAKVDLKLAGKIYDKCADVIVRRWKEKRADMIADCGIRLTDTDQYFPVDLLTATIQPQQLPAFKPGNPVSVEVRVNPKGDMSRSFAVLKEVEDGLKRLGTEKDPISISCYNQFTWVLDGKVLASEKKDLYLPNPIFSKENLTRNISLETAGTHEMELQMETRFRVDIAPSDVMSARKFLYRRFVNTVKVPLDLETGSLSVTVELSDEYGTPKEKMTVKAIVSELPADVDNYTFEWTDLLSNTVMPEKGKEMSFIPTAPGDRRFRVRVLNASGKDPLPFAEHTFKVRVVQTPVMAKIDGSNSMEAEGSIQLKASTVNKSYMGYPRKKADDKSNTAASLADKIVALIPSEILEYAIPTSVRYIWKIGNEQIGTGDTLTYTAPAAKRDFETDISVYAYPSYSGGEAPPVVSSKGILVYGKPEKSKTDPNKNIIPDKSGDGITITNLDGEVDTESGKDDNTVEISRDLVITAEPKESLNNLVVGQTAKFTAKASGCSISWEGAVEGSGGTISFTPAGSGFHTIIAKASAGGIEMVRTLSINAVPLAVELERVEPSTGSVQVSSPVKLQAKLPENVGTGKKLTYHWYSYSNATFESDYTDTPETTVRFWEARTCNVFVEVFAQAGDGLDQISQSDQLKIDVTKPELKVTMDPQQPMVGQPLTLKVEAPNATTGLVFRWELPEQLSESGESINRDMLEVIPTTAGEVVVKLIAEENKYYAEVAAIDVPFNITEYSVVASTDTLGPKPMVWDQTKGLVEEVPEISVFQYMTLKAELQPNTGREPVKYVWKLNEDSHFAFMDEGSEVTAYRSQTGECLATVTAYDKAGVELGRGSTSFHVTVSQDRILEAKTKTDDNIKSQDALPDNLHASAESKNGAKTESGNNADGNKNTDTTTNPSAIAPKTADKKDKPGDIAVDAKRDSQAWIDALKLIAEHKEAAKNKKRLFVELLWNKIEKTCKDESALKQKVEYKQAETLTVNVLAEYETWIEDTKSKAESLITAGKSAEAAAFLTEAAKRELLADDKEAIQELLDKIKG